MARIDLFTGLALVALAVGVYVATGDLATVERGIGPGDYPRVAAWGLLLFGAILAAQSALKLLRGRDSAFRFAKGTLPRMAIMVALTFVYIQVMPLAGFVLATPPFLFATMLFFGVKRYLLAAVTSVAVTVACFAIFRYAFQVMLPVAGLFDGRI
jgi:putative tricarboxylic transport membrane protein